MVDSVIKLLFSHFGIFQCIEKGYLHAPISILDMFSVQAKTFLPNLELFQIKRAMFTNLQKLEDVIKNTKLILEKYKIQLQTRMKHSTDMSDCESKHSNHTKDSKGEKLKFAEILDEKEKIFLLTLLTFDSNGVLSAENVLKEQHSIHLYVG